MSQYPNHKYQDNQELSFENLLFDFTDYAAEADASWERIKSQPETPEEAAEAAAYWASDILF